MSDELEKLNDVVLSRRDVFKTLGATTVAGALLATAGFDPAMAQDLMASASPIKCAMSNAGLQASWCAQGKTAAEAWSKLMNVELTWFDGELSATKQRSTIDNLAAQAWDFVAIQAFGIGTLTDPVKKMIDAGIPVMDMDTLIALGTLSAYGYSLAHLLMGRAHDAHFFMDAGIILTLVTLGKYLEARSKGVAGEAIERLLDLAPKAAKVDPRAAATLVRLRSQRGLWMLRQAAGLPI